MRPDTSRVRFVCLLLAGVAVPGLLPAQDRPASPPAAVERFDPSRDADADIRAAVAEAGKSGKRVLLDVGGEWCIWCRRLDTLFATHEDLRTFRDAHFVVVKVNWSQENKNERVLSRYPRVSGYPHLFVLDGDGTLLRSQNTGDLEKGKGHDPARVMDFLKQWARPE